MPDGMTVLMAEDDQGHAALIERNLRRSDVRNEIIQFGDGQEVLNFLFRKGGNIQRVIGASYVLLLDIQMPGVNGMEVLRDVKQDEELKKMPIVMLTTTADPSTVEQCHALGCSCYVTKPIEYDRFVDVITQLGHFLNILQLPQINGII
ncbi:MAG: response regulator, partial [Dehalococcoidia bacterium]